MIETENNDKEVFLVSKFLEKPSPKDTTSRI